ncbi:MAG: Rieske (2Fe-2S) protein, partial [Fimbriimonas ginsengisoli]|nr:Rieske (2Fe-2S) protein [Fimbriimonas ginsengisoli]
RMEEANEWRHPIDLVAILERSFEDLPEELVWESASSDAAELRHRLTAILHGDDPQASADALTSELVKGTSPDRVAGAVAFAAALRIARFHTNNEFGDWDRALHTFTFANAVHQGLRRTRSRELVRGIYDAAVSIYLDRFLNIPPARLPEPDGRSWTVAAFEEAMANLLDRQQQVNEAGALVVSALNGGITPERVMAAIGRALLREDRDFHTIQTVEASFRQYALLREHPDGALALVAAARYLAAHAPTVRSQGQTYEIARRLQRGENLFE